MIDVKTGIPTGRYELLGGVTDMSCARDYYRKPCGGVKVNPHSLHYS